MTKQINQVKEFMELFGQHVGTTPSFGDEKVNHLRVKLLKEEVRELEEAIEDGDLVGVLDALTDIRYVLEGAVLHFGMQDIAEKSFDAVHDSNMLKACKTIDVAQTTKAKYASQGVDTYIEEKGEYFLIKRTEDGKVLKSIDWVEQDLDTILKNAK